MSIRTTDPSDRARGVLLAHPGCAALVAAGVRSLGLDWRCTGSVWGEGLSPTILLFWVVSGHVALADGSLAAAPGDCLVVPPDIAKYLTAPDGMLHAAYIHVAMAPPWTALAEGARVLPAGRSRHVAAVIAALTDETLDEVGGGPARPLAEVVLRYLAMLTAGGLDAATQGERTALENLWREVASDPARPWNVPALARRAGLSEGHFHRRVQALFGRAPMALVRQLRLERAADLLRTTTASTADIADKVGYSTGFALSNALHRHLGVRPQQLRELKTKANGTTLP
jgi:AraC-like DNA-binding protein